MPVAIMKPSKQWDKVLDASTRREDPKVETVRGWDAACESGQRYTVRVNSTPQQPKTVRRAKNAGFSYDEWDGV